MAIVKRANVILHIKDDQISQYLDKGYSVVNAGGKVLQQAIPTDINVLKRAYVDHTARIAQLEKEIDLLHKASTDAPAPEVAEEPVKARKSRKKDT